MKTNVLILDGQNLAYRAYFSLARLNNGGKKPVSIIYGLPQMVGSFVKKFQPRRLYIAWDGKKSPHRLSLLPTYKERGNKAKFGFDPEDFYSQRDVVMELFHSLGVKQVYHKKGEADDFIYMLTRKFQDRKTVIISNDKDFHQLISENLSVYNAKDILLTPKNLKQSFGYTPDTCVDYLCLVGDDSDKIPGYPKIGPARATDFFLEHSSIANFLSSKKEYKFIDKVKLEAIWKRNRQLIDLAHYYELHNKDGKVRYYNNNRHPEMDKARVIEICDEYNISTFRKKDFLSIWSQ